MKKVTAVTVGQGAQSYGIYVGGNGASGLIDIGALIVTERRLGAH